MKLEHLNEIKGIVILALSLILLASLASFVPQDLSWFTSRPNLHAQNWIGIAGAYGAGILFFTVGLSAYFLVVIGLFWSWNKFTSREIYFNFAKFISLITIFVVSSSLLALMTPVGLAERFTRAGLVGILFCDFLTSYVSPLGSLIILLMLGTLALVVTGEFLVSPFFIWIYQSFLSAVKQAGSGVKLPKPDLPRPQAKAAVKTTKELKMLEEDDEDFADDEEDKPVKAAAPKVVAPAPAASTAKPNIHIIKEKEIAKPQEVQKPKVVGEYHLPSLDLLKDAPIPKNENLQEILTEKARILEETLADFGVNVKVVDIERGPVITRFELQPAPGVKIQQISSLNDDLALALSAPAVRILAPIPGKNRVGVEVPNGSSAAVYFKDVLSQGTNNPHASKLLLALGKESSGKPLVADLAEMPHLLVAGTTGSGKTVCLNSLIMSILYNASPSQVKFIMIDPKMVELVPYNDLPHLICPVITDAKKAAPALNWVVGEMEARYKLLNKEGVRNIKGYHAKGLELPYIVVVVDELADLMQVAAKSIEGSIARIAQLARAAGIHLILATQRPSVDVITGVIKANFSSRISFKVASKVDSRTVLDTNGAENLLGKGDLLFMKTGDPKPVRGQCCYISDEEINSVIAFIKNQGTPEYNDSVLKPQASTAQGGEGEADEMYDEAVRVVVETNQASVTILQRRLRLGYSRAARLIDMMEQKGIVGPYAGSKARDILVDREKWLIENMDQAKGGQSVNGKE